MKPVVIRNLICAAIAALISTPITSCSNSGNNGNNGGSDTARQDTTVSSPESETGQVWYKGKMYTAREAGSPDVKAMLQKCEEQEFAHIHTEDSITYYFDHSDAFYDWAAGLEEKNKNFFLAEKEKLNYVRQLSRREKVINEKIYLSAWDSIDKAMGLPPVPLTRQPSTEDGTPKISFAETLDLVVHTDCNPVKGSGFLDKFDYTGNWAEVRHYGWFSQTIGYGSLHDANLGAWDPWGAISCSACNMGYADAFHGTGTSFDNNISYLYAKFWVANDVATHKKAFIYLYKNVNFGGAVRSFTLLRKYDPQSISSENKREKEVNCFSTTWNNTFSSFKVNFIM